MADPIRVLLVDDHVLLRVIEFVHLDVPARIRQGSGPGRDVPGVGLLHALDERL